jgi:hypothetical protein
LHQHIFPAKVLYQPRILGLAFLEQVILVEQRLESNIVPVE